MFNWRSPHVYILSQVNLVHSHPISLMPVLILSSRLYVVGLIFKSTRLRMRSCRWRIYLWPIFLLLAKEDSFGCPKLFRFLYRTKKTSLFPNLKVFSKSAYWETLDRSRTDADSSWNVPPPTLLFITLTATVQIRPAVNHLIFQLWLCDQWWRESDPVLPFLSLVSWGWQPAPTWQLCSENPTLPSHMYKFSHVASNLFIKYMCTIYCKLIRHMSKEIIILFCFVVSYITYRKGRWAFHQQT